VNQGTKEISKKRERKKGGGPKGCKVKVRGFGRGLRVAWGGGWEGKR